MQLRITVTNKLAGDVSERIIQVEDTVQVGRYLDSPILLQGEGLSRYHFLFRLKNKIVEVEDLSSNGTWLNGKLLKAHASARVKSGDTIEIPGYRLDVAFSGASSSQSQPAALPVASEHPTPTWARPLFAALQFLAPMEIILVVLAVGTLALASFYLTH